jgi:hypothetical protein
MKASIAFRLIRLLPLSRCNRDHVALRACTKVRRLEEHETKSIGFVYFVPSSFRAARSAAVNVIAA